MQQTTNFSLSKFRCHDNMDVSNEYMVNILALANNFQILDDYLNEGEIAFIP
jgi:hypothetical protein